MRAKRGPTASAVHINGVKLNQSGSISQVPLALIRKWQCCNVGERDTPTLLCFSRLCLHQTSSQYSLVSVQTLLTQPQAESVQSEECWSQINGMFKGTEISPGRRPLCLFQNSSLISSGLVSVCGSLAAFCRGTHLWTRQDVSGRRRTCLWVFAEQSELHTERSGGSHEEG